jgi:hypothetical protein
MEALKKTYANLNISTHESEITANLDNKVIEKMSNITYTTYLRAK